MNDSPPLSNRHKQNNKGDCLCPEDLSHQVALFSELFLTKHLLDRVPGVTLVLNRERQIVFANTPFRRLAKWPDGESLAGRRIGDVLGCHVARNAVSGCESGEACESCGALEAALNGFNGDDAVRECTLTQQDGAECQSLTLRIWSSVLHYEGRDFIVLSGVDISHERRRLALEHIFFHDIMNLVGSINGFAELMEIDQTVDPLEVGRLIRQASQRVIEEIDTQRVLLAVEKGDWSMAACVVGSRDVLHDVVQLYASHDVARDRRIEIADNAVNCHCVTDVTLLRRILGNMVKNALEATPTGGTVTLGTAVSGDELHFWVHNPATIPVAHRQRIFQRDFSTKGAGRGLGTYSMKLLSEYLNGNVSYESAQGSGTRFVLKLPEMRQRGFLSSQ